MPRAGAGRRITTAAGSSCGATGDGRRGPSSSGPSTRRRSSCSSAAPWPSPHALVHWAPLGWGEPVVPWWGRPGFVGVAWWGGWGGPRVVNNVVVNRTTTVNVTNINVYSNVNVHNAVVGVPEDRFGRGAVQTTRVSDTQVKELTPVRGSLQVKPAAASVMSADRATLTPPAAIRDRNVVATRAPRDFSPSLRAEGLSAQREASASAAAPRSSRRRSARLRSLRPKARTRVKDRPARLILPTLAARIRAPLEHRARRTAIRFSQCARPVGFPTEQAAGERRGRHRPEAQSAASATCTIRGRAPSTSSRRRGGQRSST